MYTYFYGFLSDKKMNISSHEISAKFEGLIYIFNPHLMVTKSQNEVFLGKLVTLI